MAPSDTRRPRRTIDQQIADLEAKIAAIRARAAQKKTKADPAHRHAAAALRSLNKALAAAKDARTRKALDLVRSSLAAFLGVDGSSTTLTPAPARARPATSDDLPDALLAYVRANPGQRGEDIASALSTDCARIRPVMKRLITDGKVRTEGERRAMRYSPA